MTVTLCDPSCLESGDGTRRSRFYSRGLWTAFLTADLVKTVYMDQPSGYEQKGTGRIRLVAWAQTSTPGDLPQIVKTPPDKSPSAVVTHSIR